MDPVNVSQLLTQLRALAAQAGADVPKAPTATPTGNTTAFGDVLTQALDHVNGSQVAADKAADAFATGQGDLPTAMLAASRAQVEFRAAVEVRNRVVQAYRDVMQMTM
ncbi:MAG TPA: flagellar hook-basal body complex protein FliE [Nevskiaceae bacterium]